MGITLEGTAPVVGDRHLCVLQGLERAFRGVQLGVLPSDISVVDASACLWSRQRLVKGLEVNNPVHELGDLLSEQNPVEPLNVGKRHPPMLVSDNEDILFDQRPDFRSSRLIDQKIAKAVRIPAFVVPSGVPVRLNHCKTGFEFGFAVLTAGSLSGFSAFGLRHVKPALISGKRPQSRHGSALGVSSRFGHGRCLVFDSSTKFVLLLSQYTSHKIFLDYHGHLDFSQFAPRQVLLISWLEPMNCKQSLPRPNQGAGRGGQF